LYEKEEKTEKAIWRNSSMKIEVGDDRREEGGGRDEEENVIR